MGGHVAEKLIVGKDKITSGCGSDLSAATQMATQAVRQYGMFGEEVGFSVVDTQQASEEYNAAVDRVVRKILDVSSSVAVYRSSPICLRLTPFVGFLRAGVLTD